MSNIFLLYKTEIRKILAKKSVWAAMAVSIVLVLLTGLANLSADGHSAYVKEQETRLTALREARWMMLSWKASKLKWISRLR